MAKQNKGRKFFAASATAALVASAIVPVASAAQVNDYNKISGYAKEAVQSLVDAGVIQGDTNGNFNPLNTVTRAQAAEIFTKALELEADGDVNFSDVKKGAWYYNSIAAVVANGIFEGVSANEFAPNKSLTRSEAAKVLVDAFGLEGSESLSQFADASQVKPWAKDALETAVANGIFTGSEENGKLNLKPNAAITRQDFAVVFARTLDLAVETVDASVKAINATTVEVTFEEEVDGDDLKASNFKIDGLEVKNAAVKQSNKKVVVLTTEAQTADKEYTVSYKDEEIGKFKGVAAVIPTAIKVTTASQQAIVGQQVTVKAEVTVAEGQSKAGIPVTFNIDSKQDAASGSFNKDYVAEVVTDENGVATYTYTQYAFGEDHVTAYATGNTSVRSSESVVYWGVTERLSITQVTTGSTFANGSKVVYKVKSPEHASTSTKTGYINVAFAENVDVTPDKLVRTVTVTDAVGAAYPYQVTTGGVQTVQVKLDKNGEATFTVEGSGASVTPIVFVDGEWVKDSKTGIEKWSGDNKLSPVELQAKAPTVKFELNHTLGLKVEAKGVQNAAATTAKGQGGRDYTVTLTDSKTGKVAPEGAKVRVTFPKGSISKDKGVTLVTYDKDGKQVDLIPVAEKSEVELTVLGTKGQVTFKLIGAKDAYATPTVYVENDKTAGFSSDDLQTIGETTYFVDAVVNKSKLTTFSSADLTDETTTIGNGEHAVFVYESVDQNDFPYYAEDGRYEVTYQVSPQFADVTVSGAGLANTVIPKGTTQSVKVVASNGKASLNVVANEVVTSSSVTVSASSSQVSLEDQPATVTFSKYSSTVVTDVAKNVNLAADEFTIKGVLYSYNGAAYQYNGSSITKTKFEEYIAGNDAVVSVTKDSEGKLTFNVIANESTTGNWESARVAINNALSKADVLAQLAKLEKFSTLIAADKDAIASNMWSTVSGGAAVATTAAQFKADYETAIANPVKTAEAIAQLTTAINAAQAKHDAAKEGTAVGEYQVGAKAALQLAINNVKTTRDNIVNGTVATSGTNHETTLNTAKDTALANAVTVFDAKKVTDARQELGKVVADAKAFLASGVREGTKAGEYSINSLTALQTAVTAAEAVYNSSLSSDAALNAEIVKLADASTGKFTLAKAAKIEAVKVSTAGLVFTFSPAVKDADGAITAVAEYNGAAFAGASTATMSGSGTTLTIALDPAITPANGDTITVDLKVANVLDTTGTQSTVALKLQYDAANTKWVVVADNNFVVAP